MEYISNFFNKSVENSFDCGDNILSLSKQGSLEFDNLFWFLLLHTFLFQTYAVLFWSLVIHYNTFLKQPV